MTISEARIFVDREILRIETENPVGELRPWEKDACPAAKGHWGRVQQRIALSNPNPQKLACCDSLNLEVSVRKQSDAQKAALTTARASRQSILRPAGERLDCRISTISL